MTPPPHPEICQQVLECLPTGVFAVDREGRITFWNAGAKRITGYLKQEALGRLCSEGFLEHSECENNTAVGSMVALLATLREGRGMATQASLKAKSGHSIPVRLQTMLLRNDGGNVQGAVEIFDPASSTARHNRRQSKLSAAGCLDTLTGALNHAMIQAEILDAVTSSYHHQEKGRAQRPLWGRVEGGVRRFCYRDDGAVYCALADEQQQAGAGGSRRVLQGSHWHRENGTQRHARKRRQLHRVQRQHEGVERAAAEIDSRSTEVR
jgi:PAS domain S-box-containing protein